MNQWVMGIDLGATKVALGLVDPSERIVAREKLATDVERGPAQAVERMAQVIREMETAIPSRCGIAGIGVCSPGPLDHRTGVIIDPPNLTGWKNVPFQRMLSERVNTPVWLEHDAKASALGEFHYGAGRGAVSMTYIVVGTGVGAALILDGQLYRGPHNSAGEVGHITLDPRGEVCSCGSRGCVETFLSGPWLARRFQNAQERDQCPPESRPSGPITGELVARLARLGNPQAMEVLETAGEALGSAVASIAMLIDVDLYVIGSSVAKAGDLLLEPARRSVPRHAHRSVASRVRIIASELADDGPILGCAWLARQALSECASGG